MIVLKREENNKCGEDKEKTPRDYDVERMNYHFTCPMGWYIIQHVNFKTNFT